MKDGKTARARRAFLRKIVEGQSRSVGRIRGAWTRLLPASGPSRPSDQASGSGRHQNRPHPRQDRRASDASVDLQFLQTRRPAVLGRAAPSLRFFPRFQRLCRSFSESGHDWHGSCNKESQPNAAESTQSAACSQTATTARKLPPPIVSLSAPDASLCGSFGRRRRSDTVLTRMRRES